MLITDGGLETTLIFHAGLDLPHFAAFVLLEEEAGRDAIRSYYRPYVEVARARGVELILDTPTWRANAEWGGRLGYSPDALADANRRAVALVEELRSAEQDVRIRISGCIGPRGDGYRAEALMTPAEAEAYHSPQAAALGSADLITALTMTYPEEAIGIVRAAAGAGLPAVVSLTVETDGRLPGGQTLTAAIEQVDAETDGAASYFMVNCAHPTHFADQLGPWAHRIRGVRANASTKSHAELDEAVELDEGDPVELAERYRELAERLPELAVVGGCCGTDHRHVAEMCAALQS
jgi:S-methylmethionine-dependent homocysteine/selenocysteine methylase